MRREERIGDNFFDVFVLLEEVLPMHFLLLPIIAFVVGCQTQIKTDQWSFIDRMPFPEKEYSQLKKEGNNTVKVQCFLNTRGGDVVYASGSTIVLSPVTSYSTQFVDINLKATEGYYTGLTGESDPRQFEWVRQGTPDAQGNYVFEKVPDGEYYVYGWAAWNDGYEGGFALKKISVRAPFTQNKVVVNQFLQGGTAIRQRSLIKAEARFRK